MRMKHLPATVYPSMRNTTWPDDLASVLNPFWDVIYDSLESSLAVPQVAIQAQAAWHR
jgi:hypothetical protein